MTTTIINAKKSGILHGLLLATAATSAMITTSLIALPAAAEAKSKLPKPFVSKSLDATLMPVTPDVRSAFGLGPKEAGVLVVSLDPRGVAARSKIKAGDVISVVRGRKVKSPVDLDATVLYWLKQGVKDFRFEGTRAGKAQVSLASITLALFDAIIDLATVKTWHSVPDTAYFDYDVYYTEYSTTIAYDYEIYETEVVTLVESESWETEVTTEYASYEESYSESSSESYESSESSESYSEESEESSEESEDSSEETEDESDAEEADDSDDDSYDEPEEAEEDDSGYDEDDGADEDDSDEDDSGDDDSDEEDSSDEPETLGR